MEKISVKARGKLNLGLDVLGRRENGYHDLEMVMQTVELCDTIELDALPEDEIRLLSDREDLPLDEKNIVYQAIRLMKEEYSIKEGILARITKVLPMAAGMGGGSSDAAATLKAMDELFQLGLSEERLRELGVKLGADVPFLIMEGTALACGIGEELTRLPSPPDCYLLLVKPKNNVSTKEVYEAFDSLTEAFHPDTKGLIEALKEGSLEKLCANLGNSLEGVTIKQYPLIESLKQKMIEEGALASLMTGSGPTVFGIFKEEERAKKAAEAFQAFSEIERVFVTRWFHKE